MNKLHIGCGQNILLGWLNTDYNPTNPGVMHLDATMRFPFKEESFDYIFSEHMIEHISYYHGISFLSECFRVLKYGGRIRISTPDLKFLIGLYSETKTKLQSDYIEWSFKNFIQHGHINDTFVINNFFKAWGHCFIYDEKTLCASLKSTGFSGITNEELSSSSDLNLMGLENTSRMPPEFLKLETLTMEAMKL